MTTENEQLISYISRYQRILILLPDGYLTNDHIASAIALKLVLEKMEKTVFVATSGLISSDLSFLPGGKPEFPGALPNHRPLEVILITKDSKLGELSYQVEEGAVHIFLTPKTGGFKPEDVLIKEVPFGYELIIVIGSQSLEQLGRIYEENAEWVLETQKTVIDISPKNEYFGSLNIIQPSFVSISELLTDLLMKESPSLIDEPIATTLLTGIISATNSFQHPQTTPKTMLKAADLIDLGARHQDIVNNLYKTKDFSKLKLWGRALARVKDLPVKGLLYSTLPTQDFSKTETTGKDLPEVMREMLDHVTDYQIVVIIAEIVEGDSDLIIASLPHIPIDTLIENLGSTKNPTSMNHRNFKITTTTLRASNLQQSEEKLLQAIEKSL